MADIESSITNNFTTNTSNIIISISGGPVIESMTYHHSTGLIDFPIQAAFSLSASNYIKFSLFLDAFNLNIFTIFKPKITTFPTFGVRQVRDTNNGTGNLRFIYQKDLVEVFNVLANYPAGMCNFAARTAPISLNLEEWTYYHLIHRHFDTEVTKEFHL